MRQKPTDEQINDIRGFIDVLGIKWVEKRIAKFTSEQSRAKKFADKSKVFDPLTTAFGRVVPHLEEDTADYWHLLRLQAIARAVLNVSSAGCAGVEGRLNDLKSLVTKKVDSTVYEFHVASMLINEGHKVDFIPEGEDKTPDLMVDDSVEVECKQRGQTDVEKYQTTLFEELYRDVKRVFVKKEFSALVEIYTSAELINRKDIAAIVKGLKNIEPGEEYRKEQGETTVYVRPVKPYQSGTGITANPPDPVFASSFRHVDCFFHTSEPGRTGFFLECRFGGLTLKGREQGIPSQLKAAKSQLSQDRPAIAFVDLRFTIKELEQIDFQPALDVVDDWMRQNTSFSAVVVTTPIENIIDGRGVVQRHILRLEHGNPRHPLPPGFSLP